MSPLDCIEEGILTGNWETVCEGYERLTDKSLRLPRDSPDEIKRANKVLTKIIDIASDFLEKSEPDKYSEKKRRCRSDMSVKKKTSKKNVTEDGEDSSLELDENQKTVVRKECGATQLITNTPDPEEVERNRIAAQKTKSNKLRITRSDTSKKYDVKCNECENKFKSSRPDGGLGQKCGSCLSDKKSRFV